MAAACMRSSFVDDCGPPRDAAICQTRPAAAAAACVHVPLLLLLPLYHPCTHLRTVAIDLKRRFTGSCGMVAERVLQGACGSEGADCEQRTHAWRCSEVAGGSGLRLSAIVHHRVLLSDSTTPMRIPATGLGPWEAPYTPTSHLAGHESRGHRLSWISAARAALTQKFQYIYSICNAGGTAAPRTALPCCCCFVAVCERQALPVRACGTKRLSYNLSIPGL